MASRTAWRTLGLIGLMLVALATAKARAEDCPGRPDALGTSRVLTINPRDFPRIGTVQYTRSLPLEDKEVVLTFDDGPMPPYSNRVLEVLAEQCVRANYFIIGRMARGYPDLLKQIQAAGHIIGNHTQNHPLAFERMPIGAVQAEVEQGFASIQAALGDRRAAAPFFRIPGLLRAPEVEAYLQSRGLVTWSADVVGDDWKHITAAEVVRRSIARLDERGKGILLLHDIQPATALALPELLRQLKIKGYRIVQVAPAGLKPPGPIAAKSQAAPTQAVAIQAASVQAAPVQAASAPIATPPSVPGQPVAAPAAPRNEPAPQAIKAAAADSLARASDVPHEPVRPFTSAARPSRNMPTPDKFLTTEPGGWPPTITVPVPRAGGIGVSSPARASQAADGRFQ